MRQGPGRVQQQSSWLKQTDSVQAGEKTGRHCWPAHSHKSTGLIGDCAVLISIRILYLPVQPDVTCANFTVFTLGRKIGVLNSSNVILTRLLYWKFIDMLLLIKKKSICELYHGSFHQLSNVFKSYVPIWVLFWRVQLLLLHLLNFTYIQFRVN